MTPVEEESKPIIKDVPVSQFFTKELFMPVLCVILIENDLFRSDANDIFATNCFRTTFHNIRHFIHLNITVLTAAWHGRNKSYCSEELH